MLTEGCTDAQTDRKPDSNILPCLRQAQQKLEKLEEFLHLESIPIHLSIVVVLLFYILSKQLWSCWEGQLTHRDLSQYFIFHNFL